MKRQIAAILGRRYYPHSGNTIFRHDDRSGGFAGRTKMDRRDLPDQSFPTMTIARAGRFSSVGSVRSLAVIYAVTDCRPGGDGSEHSAAAEKNRRGNARIA